MAIDQQHRYSNEAGRTNKDIDDDFKFNKPFRLHGLLKNITAM